ncbi:MAG: hypothetical protein AAF720_05660 [Pseudomonadota bacterium]
MDDLSYIVGLGFSGDDVPRAIIISLVMAVVFATRHPVWKVGIAALFVDHVIWALVSQAAAGAGTDTIVMSLRAMVQTFTDDLGYYLVRFFGLTVLISIFAGARHKLYVLAPPTSKKRVHV